MVLFLKKQGEEAASNVVTQVELNLAVTQDPSDPEIGLTTTLDKEELPQVILPTSVAKSKR